MYPEIFHISFLHTYGALVALAFLAGLWMAARLAKRDSLNVEAVTNLGIYCALAAIVGAKLMMLIVDPRYRENPGEIFTFDTLQAGGVFYGGLIGALAVAWWYMRKARLPLWRTADVFAPYYVTEVVFPEPAVPGEPVHQKLESQPPPKSK